MKTIKSDRNILKKVKGKKIKYLDLGLNIHADPSAYFVIEENGKIMRSSFISPGEMVIDVPPCDKKYMALTRRRLD